MSIYNKIRTKIKTVSTKQKENKFLRKDKTVDQDSLAWTIRREKNYLRHLFQAYAVIKGKDRPVVTKSEVNETLVQSLVEKFKIKFGYARINSYH